MGHTVFDSRLLISISCSRFVLSRSSTGTKLASCSIVFLTIWSSLYWRILSARLQSVSDIRIYCRPCRVKQGSWLGHFARPREYPQEAAVHQLRNQYLFTFHTPRKHSRPCVYQKHTQTLCWSYLMLWRGFSPLGTVTESWPQGLCKIHISMLGGGTGVWRYIVENLVVV